MMEQYHEHHGAISEEDMEALKREYAEWEKRMNERNQRATAEIAQITAKIDSTRKLKAQIDKDKTRTLKQIMDTKNSYRKLIKLSDQLEHMSAFLSENTNVMANAKKKAAQINAEDRRNIELLAQAVGARGASLAAQVAKIEPKLALLDQKCREVQRAGEMASERQAAEIATQMEQIEAKVQSLAGASSDSATAETELSARHEQLKTALKQNVETKAQLDQLDENLEKVQNRLQNDQNVNAQHIANCAQREIHLKDKKEEAERTEVTTAKQLEELDAESARLINNGEGEMAKLRNECSALSNEILRLEEENVGRKKRLNRAEFDVELCRGEERHIRATFDEKRAIMADIESELAELDEIINQQTKELEKERADAQREKRYLNEEAEKRNARIEEIQRLTEREEQLQQRLIDTDNELKKIKAESARLQSNGVDLASRVEQLETEKRIRIAKVDECAGLIGTKRHHTTFMLQELTRLQTERAEKAEKNINQSTLMHESIQGAVELNQCLSKVQQKLAEVNSKGKSLEAEIAVKLALQERKSLAEAEKEQLEEAGVLMDEEIAELIAPQNNQQLQAELDRLNEEVNHLERVNQEMMDEINSKDESMAFCDLEEAIESEKQLEAEIRAVRAKRDELADDIKQCDGLRSRTIDNLDHVVRNKKSKVAHRVEIIQKLEATANEQRKLSKEVAQMENECRELHRQYKETKRARSPKPKRVKVFNDEDDETPVIRLTRPNRRSKVVVSDPQHQSTPKVIVKQKSGNRRQRRGLRPLH